MKNQSNKPNGKRKRLGELLIDAGLIDETILKDALEVQKVQDKKLGRILMDMAAVDDRSIAHAIADQLHIPYLRLAKLVPPEKVVGLIRPEAAEKHQMVPVKVDRGRLVVAMVNPLEYDAVNDLRFTTGLAVVTAVSPLGDVLDAISRLYPKDDLVSSVGDALASAGSVEHVQQAKVDEKSENELANLAGLPPVVRLANALLADSIRMRASDSSDGFMRNAKSRTRWTKGLSGGLPGCIRMAQSLIFKREADAPVAMKRDTRGASAYTKS